MRKDNRGRPNSRKRQPAALGKGGNGIVRRDGDRVVKELFRKSPVDLQRFKIEVQAMRLAQESGIGNVVRILESDLESHPPWYSMPLYEGHIDGLLHYTRGNVQRAASLMLPVAEHCGSYPGSLGRSITAISNPPIFCTKP